MQLFDTHCHLDLPEFDQDRSQVISQARKTGVKCMVVPAIKQHDWSHLLEVCRASPCLYPALGLHPLGLAAHTKKHLEDLEATVARDTIVAIGEIGLDFYHNDADRPAQVRLLDDQLAIAGARGLPVILHCRKAYDELIQALWRQRAVKPLPAGIVHAFNGSLQQAYKLIDLGCKLGFGGMLTFQRSRRLRELARQLPLESLVLETDAPFMTVMQHRGERNSPAYLPYVLEALIQIRNESPDEVGATVYHNSLKVFQLQG